MTQQEIERLKEKIEQEMRQSSINVWCKVHGINPSIVKYEDGKLIIPISF